MSTRALRKLERLQDSGSSQTSDFETESEREPSSSKKANVFALLGGESGSEEETEEKESGNVVAQEDDQYFNDGKREEGISMAKSKKSKKSKKNKKRAVEDEDEELNKYLEEVRKRDLEQLKSSSSVASTVIESETIYDDADTPVLYSDSNYLYFTTSRLKKSLPLLSLSSAKDLDPDTELQNLFGNLSIETIEDANSTTSLATSPEVLAQFKKLARLTRGWGGKDHKSVPGTKRKLLLTRIKDDWIPVAQKPLSMTELSEGEVVDMMYYKEENEELDALTQKVAHEKNLGVRYFKFNKINSVTERMANSKFYASVVMTPDPESLMQLLQQHPYHVETLLQVAMVMLRQGNNKATSFALVEKCLFVFDRSFDKTFHEMLCEGRTGLLRLPYESFMNRQFYLCLFRMISALGERNTFYTALNYCKFMLSLSPAEDPLGVRFFIDHYAILSEEYQYLVDLVDSPLTSTYSQWFTPGLAFSKVLALLYLGQTDKARAALKEAFSAHNYCSLQLLAVVGLATKPPVKVSEVHKDDSIILASETYLVRASILWKEQNHRQFLHDELMKLFKTQSEGSKSSWLGKWFNSKESTEIPINLIRFAILSGENKVLAKIPEKIFSRSDILEYDVIPPRDEAANYDVFTGVQESGKVTDSLFDYLDHNIISAIVQNRSAAEFEDFITDADNMPDDDDVPNE
ncbi:putative ribosome quality control complex subunit [Clavispora lusitaniae]|uniref:Ribosome quality control complex subunit n=1 Tax=Clavispora lusitaniae TaxID=36911 RepID=A0ACD0WNR9_CLALS|nr:putative ribosome quality control complex subunit [Clavispora lusitaniae]QFZ34667.1 putative ribosome quality control complex subunit [Clavispora lusitaniae]QFZ40352.1 putative ribosome quality control complex subunit [Clavispora lusitaniae]QFZ46032.1 putative ribosome quality control complex subunit [Clavispora lusitaniae]QFZ51694.1 putative ribosome quality control complex subunit [Clavispora lusitaniae]